jgi:secondary thiamine-phosphate synthase enzyme
MRTVHNSINISTKEPLAFVEVTKDVEEALKKSSIKNGLLTIATQHTTAGVCINERCERLQEDMKELFERIAPQGANYKHNHYTVDNRSNAHSHLRSLLLNTTETIPVTDGKLALGVWQSIFFIELDGPRNNRTLKVTIIGE